MMKGLNTASLLSSRGVPQELLDTVGWNKPPVVHVVLITWNIFLWLPSSANRVAAHEAAARIHRRIERKDTIVRVDVTLKRKG